MEQLETIDFLLFLVPWYALNFTVKNGIFYAEYGQNCTYRF